MFQIWVLIITSLASIFRMHHTNKLLLPMNNFIIYIICLSFFIFFQTSKAGKIRCMICISLLSLITAATFVICVPVCTKSLLERKCVCPAVPICPECGLPYWNSTLSELPFLTVFSLYFSCSGSVIASCVVKLIYSASPDSSLITDSNLSRF